ncbi:MAG: cytochrome-c peroxidase [Planctomycetota bacterium]|jgi:cytochrome c peroxidase
MNPRPLARLLGTAGAVLLAAPLFAQGGPLLPPPAPAANPVTPEKTVLGKMLYWEEQMSSDDTIACGTCHRPETGFSDPRPGTHPGPDGILGTPDDRFASPGLISATIDGDYVEDATFGFDPQVTDRHSPEIVASLYAPEAFWDGRAGDAFTDPDTGVVTIPTGGALENQVLGPPLSSVEMAHMGRDWDDVTTKLARVQPMALASDLTADIVAALAVDDSYPELFEAAFGSPEITAARIAFAIATYERTLVPDDTPWDRYVAGDLNAMTPQQVVGWNQFNGIAQCNLCHVPPVFSDNEFHNLGLRPSFEDEGRQGVTGLFADRGKFKTPSLRNAGLRTRFFHDGQKGVLDNGPAPGGVDDIYVDGGGPFRAAGRRHPGHLRVRRERPDRPARGGRPAALRPSDPVARGQRGDRGALRPRKPRRQRPGARRHRPHPRRGRKPGLQDRRDRRRRRREPRLPRRLAGARHRPGRERRPGPCRHPGGPAGALQPAGGRRRHQLRHRTPVDPGPSGARRHRAGAPGLRARRPRQRRLRGRDPRPELSDALIPGTNRRIRA